MGKYTTLVIGMGLGVLAGCTMSPLYLYEKPGLERSMPSDVAMTDYVEYDWTGYRVTVEEKLARLGAYSDAPGVIRDGTGKEIRFFHHQDVAAHPDPAFTPPPNELPELKQRFTVIEISRDPEIATPKGTEPGENPLHGSQ
jgi:hypothetical protein